MKSKLFFLGLTLFSQVALAADVCVTGVKGTLTSSFLFKVSSNLANERTITLFDNNRNQIFVKKSETQFTKFNSSGYGICSLVAQGKDEVSGAQYKVELKVSPHYQKACSQLTLPTSVEYLSLKITPKGTTLGDDLTAYALSITPCP
jgi:hypothetical protein